MSDKDAQQNEDPGFDPVEDVIADIAADHDFLSGVQGQVHPQQEKGKGSRVFADLRPDLLRTSVLRAGELWLRRVQWRRMPTGAAERARRRRRYAGPDAAEFGHALFTDADLYGDVCDNCPGDLNDGQEDL